MLKHLTIHQDIFYVELYEEYDKHEILHLHGIVEVPVKFFRCNLLEKGFNINVTPITNEFGWRMYMTNYDTNKQFIPEPKTLTKTIA